MRAQRWKRGGKKAITKDETVKEHNNVLFMYRRLS